MMADVVLSATEVGEVVTYVAPGFFAQLGYRAKFPAPEPSAGKTLIVSVVLSLPLVALAGAVTGHSPEPNHLAYVLGIIVASFTLGYAGAYVRGRKRAKTALERLGYHSQPEGSMYAQTLKHMSERAAITLELKDGRQVSGTPRRGPEFQGDGINELYLTHPEAKAGDGKWHSVGAGLIVPLGEISTIALAEDPTGAAGDNPASAAPTEREGREPTSM